MTEAGIPDVPHRTTKGIRYGYGISAITNGVRINVLQQWLGHSIMENTAIYANAMGKEANQLAALMWKKPQ